MNTSKRNIVNIIRVTLISFLSVVIWGCSENHLDSVDLSDDEYLGSTLRLQVASPQTRASSDAATEVSEKVKTLRIIILSDGFVEYNHCFDYSGSPVSAETFAHSLERSTVAGNKKIYLIANEESVTTLKFENPENLAEGIENGMSLKTLLENFPKEKLPSQGTLGYSGVSSGDEFETAINSAYFFPDYKVNDNTIFLPYMGIYDGIEADNDPDKVIEKTLYVVPVATKFTFNIRNFRKTKTQVFEFNLGKVNTSTYVMARLNEEEQTKLYNNTPYYWIDWLAKVGEEQKKLPESDYKAFNEKVGWIEKYNIPDDNELEKVIFKPESAQYWEIAGLVDKNNPSTLVLTGYYPESKNLVEKEIFNPSTNQMEEMLVESYSVQLISRDERDSEKDPFESAEMEIEPLKTLFRNTHVKVNVDMYESIVEIFCEISPWTISNPAKGFVEQKDDD